MTYSDINWGAVEQDGIDTIKTTNLWKWAKKNSTARWWLKAIARAGGRVVHRQWEKFYENEMRRVFMETKTACMRIAGEEENMPPDCKWADIWARKFYRIFNEVKQS